MLILFYILSSAASLGMFGNVLIQRGFDNIHPYMQINDYSDRGNDFCLSKLYDGFNPFNCLKGVDLLDREESHRCDYLTIFGYIPIINRLNCSILEFGNPRASEETIIGRYILDSAERNFDDGCCIEELALEYIITLFIRYAENLCGTSHSCRTPNRHRKDKKTPRDEIIEFNNSPANIISQLISKRYLRAIFGKFLRQFLNDLSTACKQDSTTSAAHSIRNKYFKYLKKVVENLLNDVNAQRPLPNYTPDMIETKFFVLIPKNFVSTGKSFVIDADTFVDKKDLF